MKHKFLTMDATRGIAAICVMVYHFSQRADVFQPFPSGPIAVDYFLCLSGFVIAHSYREKLDGGMSVSAFMRLRLIRLYPMYIFGTIIGLIASIGYWLSADGNSLRAIAAASLFAVLFAPYLRHFLGHYSDHDTFEFIFPLNGPAWSLFFEIFVNGFYGNRNLRWIGYAAIPLSFMLVVTSVLYFDEPPGWGISNFLGGFPRAMFSFFVGGLLFWLWRHGHRPRLNTVLPCCLILAMCAMPYHGISFLLSVLLLVPLTVWLSTHNPNSAPISKLFALLGEISYPVYAIHIPIYTLTQLAYQRAVGATAMEPLPDWTTAPLVGVVVILALILSRIYDQPVRKFLTSSTWPWKSLAAILVK